MSVLVPAGGVVASDTGVAPARERLPVIARVPLLLRKVMAAALESSVRLPPSDVPVPQSHRRGSDRSDDKRPTESGVKLKTPACEAKIAVKTGTTPHQRNSARSGSGSIDFKTGTAREATVDEANCSRINPDPGGGRDSDITDEHTIVRKRIAPT